MHGKILEMHTLRKIMFYLIGVALGLLIVKALFGRRDLKCSYFPNDRVLNDIAKKDLIIPPFIDCKMECLQVDEKRLEVALAQASINFEKSDTKLDSCKTYWLSHITETDTLHLEVENCNEEATILYMETNGKNPCLCP